MLYCRFTGKRLSLVALATCLSFSSSAEHLEHIEVVGQALSSTLSLDAESPSDMSPDLRDSLRRLPGLNSNGNGPLTSIVQYRGLFGARVLVNVDGGPVVGAGPNGMDPPLSNVFATPATRVTLYRGIAPVSVGAETIGGALDITRDTELLFSAEPELRGELTVQHHQLGSADHVSGSVGHHADAFYIQAFGASQKREDIEDGNGQLIPNSFYERSAYGLSGGVRHGNHELTGSLQRIETDQTGTPALAMDIDYIESDAYRLQYRWEDTDVGSFELRVFGNTNKHGMNNIDFRPMTMPMMSRLNTVESEARGYIANWQQALWSGHLSAGIEVQTAEHDSVITNPVMNNLTIENFNGVERDLSSAYGQWQSLYDGLDVTAGIRFTQVDTNAGDVSNSMAMMNPAVATLVDRFNAADRDLGYRFVDLALHVNGDIAPQWRWHGALGQKGRAPSYTELYVWLPLGISAGLADGRNYLGNLELQDELARQLDLGVTYQSETWSVAPRVFYQDIDDFIVGSLSDDMTANMVSNAMTGRPPLRWTNADATLYGIDVLMSAELTHALRLEATATFTRGDRDDLDEPLYRIAPATLLTRLIWSQPTWQITLESELVANQSRVSMIQDEVESAGYGVLNTAFQFQINQHVQVSVMVQNLLDKAYQPHLGGVNRVAGVDQAAGERLFAGGRNLALQLNMTF